VAAIGHNGAARRRLEWRNLRVSLVWRVDGHTGERPLRRSCRVRRYVRTPSKRRLEETKPTYCLRYPEMCFARGPTGWSRGGGDPREGDSPWSCPCLR